MTDRLNNITLLLSYLLNGNRDVIEYILRLKIKGEKIDIFKNSQDFWIENNFSNWLGHDIVLRKCLKLKEIESAQYNEYYRMYGDILGLENYRRTKGLTSCFNGKWWKCTEKVSTNWSDIHRIIRSDISVYELHEYDGGDVFLDIDTDIDYYFDNDLFYEESGLDRIVYVEKVFSTSILNGRFLFEDMESILVSNGNILIVA